MGLPSNERTSTKLLQRSRKLLMVPPPAFEVNIVHKGSLGRRNCQPIVPSGISAVLPSTIPHEFHGEYVDCSTDKLAHRTERPFATLNAVKKRKWFLIQDLL